MEVAKKHLLILIMVCVVAVILCLAVFQMCRDDEEESPIVIFSDEDLKCRVTSFQEPGVFDNFSRGWNNETFWFKNIGDQRIEIGIFVTMLPKGWAMIWDYNYLPIEPDSAVKVVISVFSAYLMPTDSLMFAIDLRYRVIDGE